MLIGDGGEYGFAGLRQRKAQRCRLDQEGNIATVDAPAIALWRDRQRARSDGLLQQAVIGELRFAERHAKSVVRMRRDSQRDPVDIEVRMAPVGVDKTNLVQSLKAALLKNI